MRILSGSLIYDFTVAKLNDDRLDSSLSDWFLIEFRFRKSIASEIETDVQRSLQIRRSSQEQFSLIMRDLVGDYEIPETPKSDMSAHLKFYLERLNRIDRGGVRVGVKLEVKSITREMQSRISEGRRESVVVRSLRRTAVDEAVRMPANKGAVAALERGKFAVEGDGDDDDERECAICLEKLEEGVEVIKMPCKHTYHSNCILSWLLNNHFCPFCRFHLPC